MNKDIADLSDFFGGKQSEELVQVVLYSGPVVGSGDDVPLSESMLNFEEVRVYGQYFDGSNLVTGEFSGAPSDFTTGGVNPQMVNYTAGGSSNTLSYVRIVGGNSSGDSLRVIAGGSGYSQAGVYKVIGYKKKYATTNLSVTIPVNNGNNITVNSRYEIPASALPASFLNADGTIKRNVSICPWLYDGTVWFEAGEVLYFESNSTRSGVKASKTDNSIVIRTGNNPTTGINNPSLLLASEVSLNSAPCVLVATLAGEAYAVQTP